ncbi:unnamed protein product [Fusarium graminearum]|nr:unnamed protein product [Fusarium graminearum]CAG1971496.1 unnamed protein product [Fusarium graminearum]CAG1984897.1 unnamed protein product [Fusarium graminearum]VTO88118.1 unnamed protein product [Fusarium graminearum]
MYILITQENVEYVGHEQLHSLSLERRQAEKAYFGQKVVQVTGSWPLFLCRPREVRSDVSHGLSSLDLSAFLSIQVLWCVPASDLGTLGSAPTGIELLFFGSAALYPGIILSNVKNLSDACLIRQVQHAIVIRR